MALTTRPSRAAAEFFTEQAAAIEQVFETVVNVHEQACPTQRIMLDNMKIVTIGPDELIGQNMIHDLYDVNAVPEYNVDFEAPDIDPYTRQQWSPKRKYVSAGTNDFEISRYNSAWSRIKLVKSKVDLMRSSFTWVDNYELFSNWSETLTGDEIDLSSELSAAPVPPPVKFKNVTAAGSKQYSIPMIIRKHVTGHTIGNVSSANALWQPTVEDAVTGAATRNATAADEQCDVVTDDDTLTATISLDSQRSVIHKLQRGWNRKLYGCCPSTLYEALEDYIMGFAQFDYTRETELADLSINASIVWRTMNAVYYVDPMMDDLWPATIWYYDPGAMFRVANKDFNPAGGSGIYDWERIPGSNKHATAMFHEGQLICPDRRGVGASHGLVA